MSKKKIFLMGDSILVKYSRFINDILSSKYDIYTKVGEYEALKNLDLPRGMNIGDSRMALCYLKSEDKENKINYNYCLFNCGAHDIKRDAKSNEIQVNLKEYKSNLKKIIEILRNNNVKPIFVNSVPIYDSIHNNLMGKEYLRFNEDMIEYNKVANEVMQESLIPVIDLNYFTGLFGEEALCDHIHFKPEISKYQAIFIAGALLEILN